MGSLKSSIEILRQRVRSNLDVLHQNEKKIKEILKEPVSKQRSEKLNNRFNANKEILKENNDALLLQKDIILFIENYFNESNSFSLTIQTSEQKTNNVISKNKIIELKKEDYLDLTINGALSFDENHPYYKDENFFNDLLNYYSEIEDYETCNKLTKLF